MKASVQLITDGFAIRVHEGGGYGDPYVWSCLVTVDQDGVGVIQLVNRRPSPGVKKAVAECLRDLGITEVRWERRKQGSSRWSPAFHPEDYL